MSNLTHFIDGIQVLSRAEILVHYRAHLTPATIQYFLENKKPRSWVSAKNKYWYAKPDIDQLLDITPTTDEPGAPFKLSDLEEAQLKFHSKK